MVHAPASSLGNKEGAGWEGFTKKGQKEGGPGVCCRVPSAYLLALPFQLSPACDAAEALGRGRGRGEEEQL